MKGNNMENNDIEKSLLNKKKEKNNNSLIVILVLIIIILSLVLIFTGSYKNLFKKEDNNQPKENESQNYSISEADKLLNYFGFNDDLGCNFAIYEYGYSDDFKRLQALKKVDSSKIKHIDSSEITKDIEQDQFGNYRLKYGAVKKETKSLEMISYADVNAIYKEMYGKDMDKEGLFFNMVFGSIYDYDDNLNSFIHTECTGCGGACSKEYYIKQTKSAKLINDKLIIEVYYLNGSSSNEDAQGEYEITLRKVQDKFVFESLSKKTNN